MIFLIFSIYSRKYNFLVSYITIRYADDTTLLATSPEELQHQVNELQKISLLFGLEINSAKTCMMVIDPADIGTQSAVDRWQRNRKSKQVRWGRWSRLTATVQQI